MFKDVWHARRIWRVGLEADAKDIVLVVSCHVQVIGAGLVVLEHQRRQLQLRHVLGLLQGEAMDAVAGLGQRVEHRGVVAARTGGEALQSRGRC